jgi:hypothetical protein
MMEAMEADTFTVSSASDVMAAHGRGTKGGRKAAGFSYPLLYS